MELVKIFGTNEFGSIRTIEENGKILFVGSDVAKSLGYSKPANAVLSHCRYALKRGIPHPQGNGTLEVNLITEGDLYRLIACSKLPSAQKFESWVFDEVLPEIRRSGSFSVKATKEIVQIKSEFEDFKNNMPLLGIDCDELQSLIKRTGVLLLGGKNSKAYKDRSTRNRVYFDMQKQLRREFDVDKYKAIKRIQLETAKLLVKEYKLPFVLKEKIEEMNKA